MANSTFNTREWVSMIRVLLLALWPITTLAAGASLGATLGSITLADYLALFTLSGVSGLVALLHRVRRSLEAAALNETGGDRQLIDWRAFAVAHMAAAMFAGGLVFLVCEAGDVNSYLEAAFIAAGSFSGAKYVDRLADGLSDVVLGRISALFGGGNKGG